MKFRTKSIRQTSIKELVLMKLDEFTVATLTGPKRMSCSDDSAKQAKKNAAM